MKKVIIILLAVALIAIFFVGCTVENTQKTSSSSNQQNQEQQQKPQTQIFKIGDRVKGNFYAVTANSIDPDPKYDKQYDSPEEGHYLFYKKPDLGSGTLQPGRQARGWITFEIPKEDTELDLIGNNQWVDKDDNLHSGQIIVKLTDYDL